MFDREQGCPRIGQTLLGEGLTPSRTATIPPEHPQEGSLHIYRRIKKPAGHSELFDDLKDWRMSSVYQISGKNTNTCS
jgi:hypothetical protein